MFTQKWKTIVFIQKPVNTRRAPLIETEKRIYVLKLTRRLGHGMHFIQKHVQMEGIRRWHGCLQLRNHQNNLRKYGKKVELDSSKSIPFADTLLVFRRWIKILFYKVINVKNSISVLVSSETSYIDNIFIYNKILSCVSDDLSWYSLKIH